MKDIFLAIMAQEENPVQKLNRAREYIQALALKSLGEAGAFANISFVGGTALRFLYELPRFSEDLDFSLENNVGYSPEKWLLKLKNDYSYNGYDVNITFNDKKTVQVAWIRIAHLLYEAGLAGKKDTNLSIKIEIDTRPPDGARTETRLVNRHFIFALRHHDLPSLMAGKIRAIITRKFCKGRDWYDLFWYLARRPPVRPNIIFLDNALLQQQELLPEKADWPRLLEEKTRTLDLEVIKKDIEPFLENPAEADLLKPEILFEMLKEIES